MRDRYLGSRRMKFNAVSDLTESDSSRRRNTKKWKYKHVRLQLLCKQTSTQREFKSSRDRESEAESTLTQCLQILSRTHRQTDTQSQSLVHTCVTITQYLSNTFTQKPHIHPHTLSITLIDTHTQNQRIIIYHKMCICNTAHSASPFDQIRMWDLSSSLRFLIQNLLKTYTTRTIYPYYLRLFAATSCHLPATQGSI
jgi:hypothetical protein